MQLRAQDTRDFAFSAWDGGCVGTTRRCYVQAGDVSTVRARFSRRTFTLRLTVGGPGVVRSSPPGLACGLGTDPLGCDADFGRDTTVILHERPSRAAAFGGWQGPCTGSLQDCSVRMTGNRSATAGFGAALPAAQGSITVRLTEKRHRVVSVPAGIDCSGGCSAPFGAGTLVILHAALPFGLWQRVIWQGACKGVVPSCPLLAGSPFVAWVTPPVGPFTPPTTGPLTPPTTGPPSFGLNVAVSGRGVVVGGGQINCGRRTGTLRACEGYFDVGSVVVLRALPAQGYRFAGWTGFCSGKGSCHLKMIATKVVYALFGR